MLVHCKPWHSIACCTGSSSDALSLIAGDCIPPHIDHHDFVRPFVTVSLQSEQEILFSERIISLDAGVFSGRFKMPLPPGEEHATTVHRQHQQAAQEMWILQHRASNLRSSTSCKQIYQVCSAW